MIEASWLAALAVAPLFVNLYSQRSFDPDKAAVVKSLALVMVGAWFVKVASGGRSMAPPIDRAVGSVAGFGPWRWAVLAPAVLFALSLVASSILSLDPELSWRGSYARAQGTWTRLAYLVMFAAVLSHLRQPAQLRRLQFVVMLSGLAVALYGVQQHLGHDPIPWTVRHERAGSTLGNPIFFGGFLLMTWFLTLVAVIDRGRTRHRESPGAAIPRSGVLLYAVLLGLTALVLSQSRGPILGWFAGMAVFALAVLAPGRRTRRRRVGAAVLALAALVWVATATPFAGRLATLLDPSSGTAQVRLAIWRGATQVVTAPPPVPPIGGAAPTASWLRPWIGHGPETFALTFPRFHPPELSRLEKPGSAPDRAHNVTFDTLVTAGVCGLFAWLWLVGGLCHLALHAVSPTARSPASRWRPALAMAIGGGLGVALPWGVTGEAAWVGLGLVVGSVIGLIIPLGVAFLRGESRGRAGSADGLLILAVLATLVAHVVELCFSFAVTATELYFWVLAAVLVVVSQGWLGRPSVEAPMDPPGGVLDGCRAGLPVAVVFGGLSFLFVGGLAPGFAGGDAVSGVSIGGMTQGVGVIGLWLLTGLGAVAMAPPLRGAGWAAFAGASLGPAAVLAVLHASRVFGLEQLGDLLRVSEVVSGHVSVFVGWLLSVVIVTGIALGMRAEGQRLSARRPWARRPGRALAAVVVVVLAVPWLVHCTQLQPLRADVMLKHGAVLLDAGQGERALALLSEASKLSPGEPRVFLMAGRGGRDAAPPPPPTPPPPRDLASAESSLERARQLSPLDPDHTVNMARFLVARGELTSGADRAELQRRAAEEYQRALLLKPGSASVLAETAVLAERRGEHARAKELLERALAIDPDLADRLNPQGS